MAKLRMLLSECGYCLLRCDASHSLLYLLVASKLYTLKTKAGSSAETFLYIYQTIRHIIHNNNIVTKSGIKTTVFYYPNCTPRIKTVNPTD